MLHLPCALDNFLKNVCGGKAEVTVRGEATFEWGEKLFSDTIAATWSVVHFITSHQKTLAIYRRLKNEPGSDCKWALLGAGETRYASNSLMLDRFSKAHNVIERDFQRTFNHFEGAVAAATLWIGRCWTRVILA